jgi:hypothetical protein
MNMNTLTRRGLVAALFVAGLVTQASAQQSARIRGTIEKVDGNVLIVKARTGGPVTVKMPDNVAVSGIVPAALTDIKKGSYIGISALPQPDGSQRAIHIHIFPEALRGTAEGFGRWDNQPNSTMTNATVDTMVAGVNGREIMVKYKNGEKKIIVPDGIPIVTYVRGSKDELKPGAQIFIARAAVQADGSVMAPRISVGRNGMTPPM